MIIERNLDGDVVERESPHFTIPKRVDIDKYILKDGKGLSIYEVCELLNSLSDENEQLKQELKYYKAMIHTDTSKR